MVEILKIMRDLVDDEILKKLEMSYTELKDTDISELGVDSLNVMEIVIRIEDMFGIDIDYDSFEVDQISTPHKIQQFINKYKED